MDWKTLIFFAVAVLTLTYFFVFWQNRHERVKFNFFKQKIDISLGLLALSIFLDGIIIAMLINWLLK